MARTRSNGLVWSGGLLVAALLFMVSTVEAQFLSDTHDLSSEALGHCESDSALAAATFEARCSNGGNWTGQAEACVHDAANKKYYCTYRRMYQGTPQTLKSCDQTAFACNSNSAGPAYGSHVYVTVTPPCSDQNPAIPGAVECTWPNCSASEMGPLLICDNACKYYAGPSNPDDCFYDDANTSGNINDGETMGCNVLFYPVGGENNTCETGEANPGPSGPGDATCNTASCSGDTSSGGTAGSGGSDPSGSTGTPTTPGQGSSAGTPGLPGDDDADGTCEVGENCASDEGQGDILGEILNAITGQGIDPGLGGDDYAGSGGDQGQDMLDSEKGKDYGKPALNVFNDSAASSSAILKDGLNTQNFGAACPSVAWASSTGVGAFEVDTANLGAALQAVAGFALWIFVGFFGVFHLYRSMVGS